jgi:hypothetical protein
MTTTKQNKPDLPPMKAVKSAAIKSIGYVAGTAYVQYANGGTFAFPGVKQETYNKIMQAESIGRAFQSEIAMKIKGSKIEG